MPAKICAAAAGDEPGQELGRLVAGARRRRRAARRRPRAAARPRSATSGTSGERERRPPRSRPHARAAPPARARDEARQHDDAQRAGDQHEREVDAVGGEEAVRLHAVTELARQNDARATAASH